jgi:hypothetical protein
MSKVPPPLELEVLVSLGLLLYKDCSCVMKAELAFKLVIVHRALSPAQPLPVKLVD